jgi:hypothetical protein
MRQIARRRTGKSCRCSEKFPGNSEASWRKTADGRFAFGSFRFDARTGQLWRDGTERGAARGQVIGLTLLESMFSVLGPEAGDRADATGGGGGVIRIANGGISQW